MILDRRSLFVTFKSYTRSLLGQVTK